MRTPAPVMPVVFPPRCFYTLTARESRDLRDRMVRQAQDLAGPLRIAPVSSGKRWRAREAATDAWLTILRAGYPKWPRAVSLRGMVRHVLTNKNAARFRDDFVPGLAGVRLGYFAAGEFEVCLHLRFKGGVPMPGTVRLSDTLGVY